MHVVLILSPNKSKEILCFHRAKDGRTLAVRPEVPQKGKSGKRQRGFQKLLNKTSDLKMLKKGLKSS